MGILSLFGYQYLGLPFKIIISTVIFLMIWSKRPEFFPGLAIHLIAESMSMYTILFSCLFTVLLHWKYWKQTKIKWLFLLVIIPLPIFFWQTYSRYFEMKLGFLNSITPMEYYLGLFPFFYGVLISKKKTAGIFLGIIIVLIISSALNLSGLFSITVRLVFFSIPCLITYAFTIRIKHISSRLEFILLGSAFIVSLAYLLIAKNTTFTLLLSTLFGWLLTFLKKNKFIKLTYFLSSKWAFIITIIFVLIVANSVNNSTVENVVDLNKDMSQLKLTNVNDFKERLAFKSLGDRAPIWRGVLLSVIAEKNVLPPLTRTPYDINTIWGKEIKTEIGAHNIFLELLRCYGIIIGIISGIIYITQLVYAGYSYKLLSKDPLSISILSTVISVGVIGGMTGQFVLLASFSFLLMSLAGIFYGRYIFPTVN